MHFHREDDFGGIHIEGQDWAVTRGYAGLLVTMFVVDCAIFVIGMLVGPPLLQSICTVMLSFGIIVFSTIKARRN